MADNITLPGTGQYLAADDIAGAKHQRVKVSVGIGGAAADCSEANPLPVVQQDPDDSTRQAELDVLFPIPITIDVAHHEIHEGDAFGVQFVDETMADNETIILAFKTPSGTKRAHMLLAFSTLAGGDVQVWEGATWTTNTGTLVDIINRKRLTSPASSALLEDTTSTPTFAANDKIIANPTGLGTGSAVSIARQFAFGLANRISPGAIQSRNEWILKPDAQYAIVFTADGGSNKAQLELDWYEHTDA